MAILKDIGDIRRFWSKVSKGDGCWEWQAARNHRGYGQFRLAINGKSHMQQAHRVSWLIHYSELPSGLHVCHHCDNPGCVRPDHLFLGTDADNAADRDRKGRGCSRTGPVKLANEDVNQLFAMRDQGMTQKQIASALGCSHQLVSRYLRGEIKHLSLVGT